MEEDLGIDSLGTAERDIIYAVQLLSHDDEPVETEQIKSHHLLEDVSRSKFFRALRELVDRGYLRNSDGRQRSSYVLTRKL